LLLGLSVGKVREPATPTFLKFFTSGEEGSKARAARARRKEKYVTVVIRTYKENRGGKGDSLQVLPGEEIKTLHWPLKVTGGKLNTTAAGRPGRIPHGGRHRKKGMKKASNRHR